MGFPILPSLPVSLRRLSLRGDPGCRAGWAALLPVPAASRGNGSVRLPALWCLAPRELIRAAFILILEG